MEILSAFRQGNFSRQFEVSDEFDEIVIPLLKNLRELEDSVDGIKAILDKLECNTNRHAEVYKECYQLFLSFVSDLEIRLKELLNFPFHKILDEHLADIPYRFSNENLSNLLENIKKLKSIDQITSPQQAIQEYRLFMQQFDIVAQFIYSLKNSVEDLRFVKVDIHLLSNPTTFHKRNLVLDLFSPFKKG